MDITPHQHEILQDMAADPNGENPYAVPYTEIRPLELKGLVQFSRVTRHARITVYRITVKGRRVLMGAESQ